MAKFYLYSNHSEEDSSDLGIDFGTSNFLVYRKDKGIVLNEPSVVAVEKGTKKIIAVGTEARKMLQRVPEIIIAIRPMRDGVIADIESAEKMFRYFISKALPRYRYIKPRMAIGIPSDITEVELRGVEESAYKSGAREVHVIDKSILAAIGANIPIGEPAGHMICDIGGGTTEIAVIALGKLYLANAIRLGGDEFDRAILKHMRNVHNLIINAQMAEQIKMKIGNVAPAKTIEKMKIKGTHAITGLSQQLEIDSVEVSQALEEPVTQIVHEIETTLGKTCPEFGADIVDRGIVMTGEGSLLKGLDKLIEKKTGVPVIVAEQPGNCAVIGAGKHFDYLKS